MSKIHTIEGIFGGYDHYDDDGNYVGSSLPGLFEDCFDHYDSEGKHVGFSMNGVVADSVHYFDNGDTGYSVKGMFGTHNYIGTDHVGDTYPDVIGYTTDFNDGW